MNIKKIISILIVLAIVLPLIYIPAFAAGIDPYDTFSATAFDEKYSTPGREISTSGGILQVLWQGWVCYKNVNFGDNPPYAVDIGVGVVAGNATEVELRIDAPDGKVIATVPIIMGSWMQPTISTGVITEKVTGNHDLYMTFPSKTANLFSLCFYAEDPDKFEYQSYNGNSSFDNLGNDVVGQAADLLCQLGLIDKGNGNYNPIMPVTRGSFANAIYRIYIEKENEDTFKASLDENPKTESEFTDIPSDSKYSEAAAYLSTRGVMNGIGDGRFGVNDYITNIEAITVILRVLGYKELAEAQGGYPNGYNAVARRRKLSTGSGNLNEFLRYSGMALMLMDALYADSVEQTKFMAEGYAKYEPAGGIMSVTQNVHIGRGVVNASAISGLDLPESGLATNEVAIDGVIYKTGTTPAIGLLGFECDFFYEDVDNVKTLRAIVPATDVEFTEISSVVDKISKISDTEITYTLKGEEKEEKIELDNRTTVIYNGVVAEDSITRLVDYEDSFTGFIRYIENPTDSKVLFVEEYADYIIESIDVKAGLLKGKGLNGVIEIGDENDFVISKDALMRDYQPSKLTAGDLVTVYISKNKTGTKFTRIYLSENSVTGTVNRIENGAYYIDDSVFTVSNNFDGRLSVGQYGTFLLNTYGDVVGVSKGTVDQGWQIGLFLGATTRDVGFDKEISVKMVGEDGKISIIKVADSITGDGIRLKGANEIIKANNATGWVGIDNIAASLPPEVCVRYILNSDGELAKIDTLNEGAGGPQDTLLKVGRTDVKYRWNSSQGIVMSQSSSDGGGAKFYFSKEGTVFSFLDTEVNAREEECYVGLAKDIIYDSGFDLSGQFYSTGGEKYHADVFIWEDFSSLLSWGGMRDQVIFKKIISMVDDNGDIVQAISGVCDGKDKEYILGNEILTNPTKLEILNSIKTGDLLNISVYPANIARDLSFRIFFDGAVERTGINGTTLRPTFHKDKRTAGSTVLDGRYIYGDIIEREDTFVVVNTGGGTREIVPITTGNFVQVYEREYDGERIATGGVKASNLTIGDTIYAYIDDVKLISLIVYKDVKLK